MGILLFILCYLVGTPLLVGALLNSGWLLAPPETTAPGRWLAALRERLGRSGLRLLAGGLGLALILLGLVALLAPTV